MNKPISNNSIEHVRHTLAHLLAAAVTELYPKTILTIGPAVENGFYYDMDFAEDSPISEKDFPAIEKKMRELLKTWTEFTHKEVTADEARAYFTDNKYKLELIDEIVVKGEKITLYTSGTFTDLCRGGHVEHPSKDIAPDSFKLTRIAGAYWRGDEKNKMLSRVYGLAFHTKEELDAYEHMMEEAAKRDHRKIGKELKLFTISELVGAGLPLMQPKGAFIKKTIEDYLWDLHKDHGYQRVWTPHLAKEALYETSGHAGHYMDDMFSVFGGSSKEKFYVKPMNCPHHMQIFADNQFSYRDMPIRYFEPGTVYRDEKSGQLAGLTRVRSITQDDGHIFCRASQIQQEAKTIISIIKQFYTTMKMIDGYWVRLSLRGDDKSQYLGSDEVWSTAESALTDVCVSEGLPYKPAKDEAAFYGPKLDFMFKDAIGREQQLATLQCDFNLPERFDLFFINEKGEKERPVVIHRAISGSLERFMGVMIEHFSGDFPLWLSPTQVKVIPIGERQHEYAQKVHATLKAAGIRSDLDDSNDGFGKKVRAAKVDKLSYWIVIGDKEIEANKVTLESRDLGQLGQLSLEEVLTRLSSEIKNKK